MTIDVDVFLCHNSNDKPTIIKIADALKQYGLNPWIDKNNISPGAEFQKSIEQAILQTKSAAIFFGVDGVGKWQFEEINALYREKVKRGISLIPILLPGVFQIPTEHPFLQGHNYLKLEQQEVNESFLKDFIRGINGENIQKIVKKNNTAICLQRLQDSRHIHSSNEVLVMLSILMQIEEIKSAVKNFTDDFQIICKQISILGKYKDLHDLLHQLQFDCYQVIKIELKNFSENYHYHSFELLRIYEISLLKIIDKIQEVILNLYYQEQKKEESWILELIEAKVNLSIFMQSSEIEYLKKTVAIIDKILRYQPSRINQILKSTARKFRLVGILVAMKTVHIELKKMHFDLAIIEKFEQGTQDLESLNNGLNEFLEIHDQWQGVENELRMLNGELTSSLDISQRKDMDQFRESWEYIKDMIEILYKQNMTDRIALDLKKYSESLDKSINNKDINNVKEYFRSYQSLSGYLFYQADLNVKKKCDDLLKLQHPLLLISNNLLK